MSNLFFMQFPWLLQNLTCAQLEKTWKPGEQAGRTQLTRFIRTNLASYPTNRDLIAQNTTSHLSPYLHWGELSIREIWHSVQKTKKNKQVIDVFLNELGFREFSYYLLYHFPRLPKNNFQPRFNKFPWKSSQTAFKKWKEGKTGYPIVDAGMRQLKETGWVHNRARMILGSFLVKDLLIDWRKGEAWFWECLVDGDLALNSFNWQWVAGSGADAAPYFRVFNPILQGTKFDPDGEYVRRWIPELEKVKGKKIHSPWELSDKELAEAGVVLGKTYPLPIVDHAEARDRALALFKKL